MNSFNSRQKEIITEKNAPVSRHFKQLVDRRSTWLQEGENLIKFDGDVKNFLRYLIKISKFDTYLFTEKDLEILRRTIVDGVEILLELGANVPIKSFSLSLNSNDFQEFRSNSSIRLLTIYYSIREIIYAALKRQNKILKDLVYCYAAKFSRSKFKSYRKRHLSLNLKREIVQWVCKKIFYVSFNHTMIFVFF